MGAYEKIINFANQTALAKTGDEIFMLDKKHKY